MSAVPCPPVRALRAAPRGLALWFGALLCAAPSLAQHRFVVQGNERLAIVGVDGAIEWELPWGGIHDVHVLPNGNLMLQRGASEVVEIATHSKRVVWSYDSRASHGDAPVEVHALQPLEGGRVMIAESGPGRIIVVDRAGKIEREIALKLDHPHPHTDTRLARILENGNALVCHEGDGVVREYDAESGAVVWEFAVPLFGQEPRGGHGSEAFGNKCFAAVRLADGHTLVTTGNGHSVLRVTPRGEVDWRLEQHDLEGVTLAWVTTIEALSNGNIVLGNCHAGPGQPVLIEVEPATKRVVWRYDGYDTFGNNVSNTKLLDVGPEAALLARAREVHWASLTLDTHKDIRASLASEPSEGERAGRERADLRDDPRRWGPNQVDFPKMRAGGLDAAFYIVYVGQGALDAGGFALAKEQALAKFDAIERQARRFPDDIVLARTPDEVRRAFAAGKLVSCIGIENGYAMGEDLSLIAEFERRGARYMSITHNGHSQLGDSNTPAEPLHGGLSALGERAIDELNRVGIMVDVSHAGKATMMQALERSRAPVLASHSGVRALCDHPRNLDDEQLRALAAQGGVLQCVAFDSYVVDARPREAAIERAREALGLPPGQRFNRVDPDDPDQDKLTELRARVAEIEREHPRADVARFVDHIDHAVEVMGIDHVAISSDFDGGGGIEGWRDASETFNVTLELVRRGYSAEQVAKLWSGNTLRLWEEVAAVSAQIAAERAARAHSYFVAGPDFTGIVDEAGAAIWDAGEPGARDGYVLDNGNVLIAWSGRVVELTRAHEVVFEYRLSEGNRELGTAQRLASGNTLITELGPRPRLIEVTPAGAIAVDVPLQPETDNGHMQTRMARKLPSGNYLVPHLLAFQVKEYTPAGEVVHTLRTDLDELGGRAAENWPFTAIRLPNGHTLVGLTHGDKVVEFDAQGGVAWSVSNDDLPGRPIVDACGVQRLANGNTVIACYGQRDGIKLFEVDREKRVVWSDAGPRRVHHFQVLTTDGVAEPGPPLK
ncbi:MAG: membrane dipeptidase [Planctomycetota bacterium]